MRLASMTSGTINILSLAHFDRAKGGGGGSRSFSSGLRAMTCVTSHRLDQNGYSFALVPDSRSETRERERRFDLAREGLLLFRR